jgi:hypothetical protein
MQNEKLVNLAKQHGIHNIRCNLTGAILGQLSDESIDKAISFELYQHPIADDESVMDSLQLKWFIQSSKPAPHLVGHSSPTGFKFLRNNYPKDLFAILASRLLFDSLRIKYDVKFNTNLAQRRLQWLIELNDSISDWTDAHQATLEQLVRLDAIHNVRQAIYDTHIAAAAESLRTSEFNFDYLLVFVDEVENCGFIKLATMKTPPTGNQFSLLAALDQHGLTPDNIVRAEEKHQKQVEQRRAAIASVGSYSHGNTSIRRGVKTLFALVDVVDKLPEALAEQYKAELASRKVVVDSSGNILKKPKEATKAGDKKATETNKKKAMARFGNVDIDF